jgi:hypothetical protein
MVTSFSSRLRHVMREGRLTVSDLSRWFGRPYGTVRSWLEGRNPWGPAGEDAHKDLDTLEHAVRNKKGFPVPSKLSPSARRDYMLARKHDRRDTQLFASHFTE